MTTCFFFLQNLSQRKLFPFREIETKPLNPSEFSGPALVQQQQPRWHQPTVALTAPARSSTSGGTNCLQQQCQQSVSDTGFPLTFSFSNSELWQFIVPQNNFDLSKDIILFNTFAQQKFF